MKIVKVSEAKSKETPHKIDARELTLPIILRIIPKIR